MKPGQGLEQYLDTLNANYRRLGLAAVFKVPTPVQIASAIGRKVTGRKMAAIWVDYSGVLRGGRAVGIEAKFTATDNKSFGLAAVTDHQRGTLTIVNAMGGVAALYVRHGKYRRHKPGLVPGRTDYLVPISFVDQLTKRSFRWDEVTHYKIPTGRTWVEAAEQWAEYTATGWPGIKGET